MSLWWCYRTEMCHWNVLLDRPVDQYAAFLNKVCKWSLKNNTTKLGHTYYMIVCFDRIIKWSSMWQYVIWVRIIISYWNNFALIDYFNASFLWRWIIEIYAYSNNKYIILWPLISTDRHICETLLISKLCNTNYVVCMGRLMWIDWCY